MPVVASPSYPDNTGLKFDFSSIEFDVDGTKLAGVAKISYSETLEPGEARGSYAHSLGASRGQYEAEGSLEMLKEDANQLIALLSTADPTGASSGLGYGEKFFTCTVSYSESGQPVTTDKLFGCRIKKVGDDHAVGPDVLIVSMDLRVQRLERNGYVMISKVKR